MVDLIFCDMVRESQCAIVELFTRKDVSSYYKLVKWAWACKSLAILVHVAQSSLCVHDFIVANVVSSAQSFHWSRL